MDFSVTSMQISQRRARARRLRNIVWLHCWIEESKLHGLGIFEFVESSGVIHHLKRPEYGLNTLKDLTFGSGMNLMVYAQFGRTAIYMIQHLMRRINANTELMNEQLRNANRTLDDLPRHHWFLINTLVNDHKDGDIGK